MMFAWVTNLLRPGTPHDALEEFIEEFTPGHRDRMVQYDKRNRDEDARFQKYLEDTDPFGERACKKRALEQELKDAEWILDYERRLAKLQERVAAETNRTGKRGRSPTRLQNLQSHLRNVRGSITLD